MVGPYIHTHTHTHTHTHPYPNPMNIHTLTQTHLHTQNHILGAGAHNSLTHPHWHTHSLSYPTHTRTHTHKPFARGLEKLVVSGLVVLTVQLFTFARPQISPQTDGKWKLEVDASIVVTE